MATEIGLALLLFACCVVILEQFLLIFPHDPMQKLTFKPLGIRSVTCSLLGSSIKTTQISLCQLANTR
jgi:hypothetical protein